MYQNHHRKLIGYTGKPLPEQQSRTKNKIIRRLKMTVTRYEKCGVYRKGGVYGENVRCMLRMWGVRELWGSMCGVLSMWVYSIISEVLI